MSAALRFPLALVGAAAVIFVWSELVFFNESVAATITGAPDIFAALAAIAEMIAYYLIPAAVLASALTLFRARSLPAIFLAGCLTGWTIEGALVPAVHEGPPISLFWTSVAWHVPVDILIGVILLPTVMRRESGWQAYGLCAFLGAGWGFWNTWVWIEQPPLSVEAFAIYAALASIPLVAGTIALARFADALWEAPRWLIWTSLPLAGLLIVIWGMTAPTGLAMLLPLIAMTLLALWRGRRASAPPSGSPEMPRHLFALLLMPPFAILSYAICVDTGVSFDIEAVAWILALGSVPLFLLAVFRTFTSG